MLTQYESILAVPDEAAAFGYRFYAAPFQAGAQTTVPELAELTFLYHIPKECSQDGEAPDRTQIARISRTDLACYMHSDCGSWMCDGGAVGYAETVLYRDSELDAVYEQYLTGERAAQQVRWASDEEIPF